MRLFTVFSFGVVALTALVGLTVASSAQTDPLPIVPGGDREQVSVTVYNQGTALIQDRRTFDLPSGLSLLNFTDVAATIDATSVSFKSLTRPESTYVLEQNYVYDLVDSGALLARYLDETIQVTMLDGTIYEGQLLSGRNREVILRQSSGEVVVLALAEARDVRFPALPDGLITRPTLRWLIQSADAGEQQVELTYLAGGLNWTADYILLVATDNRALDLNGWVTVTNTSGTAYQDAQLKLVAGDVNRIREALPEMSFMRDDMATPMAAPTAQVAQREFFEYQLYEVARPVTLSNNETKQVEFVTRAGVPARTFYVYDGSTPFYGYGYAIEDPSYGSTGVTTVGTYLEFSTGAEAGVDADLPAGRVRVYQQDSDGSALLIGENRISHTPKGEDLSLYLGNAFDLVGQRRQTDYTTVSRRVIQETFEIRLRNRKEDQAVEIRVPEHLYRWSDWEILNASTTYTQIDSTTIEFRVEVPPGGETVITYTVQYRFP
jgi:hypothetical protein